MMRIRLLFALAVALVALSATAAYAGGEAPLTYQWTESDFAPPADGVHWVYKKHNLDFEGQGAYEWDNTVGDAGVVYSQSGAVTVDPIVNQTVRNFTQDAWTDWHVEITNGYIELLSANVYNLQASSPSWVVEYEGIVGNTASGFFAHVVTGMDTQVDPFEQLLVNFVYEPDTLGAQVTINQYPTKDWPIPEPGSMAALLAGLAGLGLGAIRRRAS